jgi:uncharacterized protein
MTPNISDILRNARTIAIVGISSKPHRASFQVAEYLQNAGYRIVPINPRDAGKQILGETCYASLTDFYEATKQHIDIVDCFRKSEDIPPIVEQAIAVKAGCVWMQLDIENDDAKQQAEAAGIAVVMNRCTKIDHRMLGL